MVRPSGPFVYLLIGFNKFPVNSGSHTHTHMTRIPKTILESGPWKETSQIPGDKCSGRINYTSSCQKRLWGPSCPADLCIQLHVRPSLQDARCTCTKSVGKTTTKQKLFQQCDLKGTPTGNVLCSTLELFQIAQN